MELRDFCSTSRVVIVAGKGGVGRTTVSAALAVAAARTGLSVLVAEIEGKSGLAAAFGAPPIGYEEAELGPGVRARALAPDDALVEYLADHGLRRFSRRLVHSGVLDVVSHAVPGLRDLLLLGKVKALEQAGGADLVVVDAAAAGHALTFLTSPQGLLDAVGMGPVHRQAAEVVAMLRDPARCSVVLVTIPEETPVNEVIETAYALEDRVGIALGPIVVNMCDLEVVADPSLVAADVAACGLDASPRELAALRAATAFRAARAARQRAQVERLASRLPLAQLHLPLVSEEIGPAELGGLADALERGVAALAAPGPTTGPRAR